MLAAESLGDASCPQPDYQQLVEAEVMEAMPGMFMVASRAAVEATFKNTEVFSSEGFLELGNVRPLIPLSVDPPRHLKYRKILDPIFAPKQMDAIEDDVTASRQPLHRPVRRPRRVPLHQRVRGAVPVGGVPRPHGAAVGGARHASSA